MIRSRRARTIATWLAQLAVCLQVLLPAAAQPFGPAGGVALPAGVVEVCTSGGALWLNTDDGTPVAPGSGELPHVPHCPLCGPATAAPLPVVALVPLLRPDGEGPKPEVRRVPRACAVRYATVPPQCGPPSFP